MSALQDMYQCQVHNCGYVYDPARGDPKRGIGPGTAFAALSDDWTCPFCQAHKRYFRPLGGPGSVFWENVCAQPSMAGKSQQEVAQCIAGGQVQMEFRPARSSTVG